MIEFTVMDIDPVSGERSLDASMGNLSQRHVLADAWVVRSSELGLSADGADDMIHCRTHLGHLLRPGDVVLGYDLRNSNTNDDEFEKIKRSSPIAALECDVVNGSSSI